MWNRILGSGQDKSYLILDFHFDKVPIFELGIEQSFGKYISSNTESSFITTKPYLNIDYEFLNDFVFDFEYENYNYRNKSYNQTDNYQLANFSLIYQKEDSPWSFKVEGKNIFDIKYKQSNSFSSYIISDTKTYIQPLSVVFSIGFNL